jgi:hypothetical protein
VGRLVLVSIVFPVMCMSRLAVSALRLVCRQQPVVPCLLGASKACNKCARTRLIALPLPHDLLSSTTCVCPVVHRRADQHWQQVVCSHVMHCWRGKAARGAAKWQALAKALCFHKQQLLSRALQAWALAVQQQQEARAAAEGVLGLVAQALQLQCAAGVLQQWQQAAQLQVEHRQLLALAAARRQQRTQQQVGWELSWQRCPSLLLA